MNKQEIEQELVRARAAETTIKNNIIELLEQLVESEKPKLRHGDFGCFKDGTPRICIMDVMYDKEGRCGNPRDVEFYTKLGNLFDLTKGWHEPFGNYKKNITCDNRTFIIEISNWVQRDLWIGVKDNNVPTEKKGVQLKISEAEEIWHALGHAIAELKRKENKA